MFQPPQWPEFFGVFCLVIFFSLQKTYLTTPENLFFYFRHTWFLASKPSNFKPCLISDSLTGNSDEFKTTKTAETFYYFEKNNGTIKFDFFVRQKTFPQKINRNFEDKAPVKGAIAMQYFPSMGCRWCCLIIQHINLQRRPFSTTITLT